MSHSHIIQSLDTPIPCQNLQHFINYKLQLQTLLGTILQTLRYESVRWNSPMCLTTKSAKDSYMLNGSDRVVHGLRPSLSLNEENTSISTSEVLQQRESKDQKVLTGRKLALEQAVMTTSQHVGVASSIWRNKTRSFAAAWWLSNNALANGIQRA